MINRIIPVAILATLLLAVIGLPSSALAQSPEEAAPSAEQMQGLFIEMQQVHQQLEEIQRAALMDPDLNARQVALGEEIRMAMEVADPMMAQRMTRVQELETEVNSAQQAGNTERLQELMSEAQQIQQHFMSVQESALAEPAIAARLEDFQTHLEAKMIEVDPEAEGLIVRFRELEEQIAAVMGGA